jgi:hypothetical protein
MAVVKAHANVASSCIESMVSIAEAKKTAAMLRSPLARSRELIDKMVGRRLFWAKKGLNAAAAATAAFLEVRFGFMPILYDFKNAVEAYNSDAAHKSVQLVARGSQKISGEDRVSFTPVLLGITEISGTRATSWEYKSSCGVLFRLDETADASLQRLWGLRIRDVPSAAWELITLSFVVDRFVAVGAWLEAITPKPGVTMLGKWRTDTQSVTNTHSVVNARISVGSPLVHFNQYGGLSVGVSRRKDRTATVSLPPLPPVNPGDLGLIQHIDHINLLLQKMYPMLSDILRKAK